MSWMDELMTEMHADLSRNGICLLPDLNPQGLSEFFEHFEVLEESGCEVIRYTCCPDLRRFYSDGWLDLGLS